MPSWKIHLDIATGLYLTVKNKDAFLLANIAPDIENGWILTDIQNYTPSCVSHFCSNMGVGQELPDTKNFLKHCKETLSTDIGLGYYIHLLTDYFWNDIVNKKCFLYGQNNQIIGIQTLAGVVKGDKQTCNTVKQKDFQIFSDGFMLNEFPVFEKLSATDLKNFEEFFHIPSTDLKKAAQWIENNILISSSSEETQLFTRNEYNSMLQECIHFIEKEIR